MWLIRLNKKSECYTTACTILLLAWLAECADRFYNENYYICCMISLGSIVIFHSNVSHEPEDWLSNVKNQIKDEAEENNVCWTKRAGEDSDFERGGLFLGFTIYSHDSARRASGGTLDHKTSFRFLCPRTSSCDLVDLMGRWITQFSQLFTVNMILDFSVEFPQFK